MASFFGQVRLSADEKIGLVSNIATMLAAGIPIIETVEALLEEAKGNQRKILLALQTDISAGKQISDSFAKYPYVFDIVTVNLIRAAEEAGTLEATLKDLQSNIKQEMEFSDKVRGAMFYPIIVLLVFVGVMGAMLFIVIPRISGVFERLRVEVPLPTKIMIASSNALVNNGLWIGIGAALLAVSLFLLFQTKRELFMKALFSLPGVSNLIRQIDITRFCRSLHLLLASGVPITNSLELAQAVILKKDVGLLVERARDQALAGHPFSAGLRTTNHVVPPMMVKLLEVGEKTGTLEQSTLQVAEHMDYQVSKSLKKLTAMMEPLMLVIVGVAVGGMMMAIIAPIYGLIGQVGQ
ncbi:MAG: type II secretion system F family protein [Patescibacteria group bacterium]